MAQSAAPTLSAITVYPIKTLDGTALKSALLLQSGALEWDRRWKIVDTATGDTITVRRDTRLHLLRAEYDLEACRITLTPNGGASSIFSLSSVPAERGQLDGWLSAYLEREVTLAEDCVGGFPDDPRYPGPTLVSLATLEQIAEWFPGVTPQEMLRRMRTNLIVSGVPAFWEDGLYTAEETGARLAFGEDTGRALLEVVNPCLRCVVPTRDTRSGEVTEHFATQFMAKRIAALPDGVAREPFEKPFRLAVNTVPTSTPSDDMVQVGNRITICR